MRGSVENIFISRAAAGPMESVAHARVVAGKGLEGDRYYSAAGTWSKPGQYSEITLIESEALEALARDYKIALRAGESRRNFVTRGVALNHLVGRRFRIGSVEFEGTKLADPCSHLERLTKPGVKFGLTHRGGLCARALADGIVERGAAIEIA